MAASFRDREEGITKLPPYTYVIKDGFLYAYVVDEEEGMEYVKRYKIKNWEQIKFTLSFAQQN
jgi:hypothetical protein